MRGNFAFCLMLSYALELLCQLSPAFGVFMAGFTAVLLHL